MTTRGRTVGRAEFDRLRDKHLSWGRWGPQDEVGALNKITPAHVARAASLVRTGEVLSLAMPLGQGPRNLLPPRFAPVFTMTRTGDDVRRAYDAGASGMQFTDDLLAMPLQTGTHWDALAHVFHDGQMYNGRGPEAVPTAGAQRSSIAVAADRMAGRGVLLDVPRLTGRAHLDIGEAIEADDLEACVEGQHVEVGEADFVLIRTGRLGLAQADGEWGSEWAGGPSCGIEVSAIDWLCSRDIAAVAADTFSVEIIPAQTSAVGERAPMHSILLAGAGIYVGEFWALDDLAAHCARTGSWEFLLTAPPLVVPGAVGSACNPLAIT